MDAIQRLVVEATRIPVLADPASSMFKLGGAVLGHQDVAGLEIAMDHQVLVAVLTAEQTWRKSFSREAIGSLRPRQYSVMGSPRTYSITK